MVRVTAVLKRVPVIKFRKGGLGLPAAPSTSSSSPAPSAAAPAAAPAVAQQAQASAPMSTSAISDIDLPAKYRRQPLSEEEIAHINGGGIV